MMETIFQIGLIVIDALLIATTESKAVKIMGIVAIIFFSNFFNRKNNALKENT